MTMFSWRSESQSSMRNVTARANASPVDGDRAASDSALRLPYKSLTTCVRHRLATVLRMRMAADSGHVITRDV